MHLAKIVVTIITVGLMSSCSNSGSSSDPDMLPDASVQLQVTEHVDGSTVDTTGFIGTWTTECFSSDQNSRDSFIYDGENASFITQTFSDALCENAQSSTTRSGKITFGMGIVESTYGVTALEFTFASDESLTDDFRNIIYARDKLLYFGDKASDSNPTEVPVALDASRTFTYTGSPDFSNLDSNSVELTFQIASFLDDSTPISIQRAVDQSALILSATVNGLDISLTQEADNWIGRTTVAPDTTVSVAVDWYENYNGTPLQLAQASINTTVETQPILVVFNSNSYITSFDADGDGVSNLAERENGTNPLDAISN